MLELLDEQIGNVHFRLEKKKSPSICCWFLSVCLAVCCVYLWDSDKLLRQEQCFSAKRTDYVFLNRFNNIEDAPMFRISFNADTKRHQLNQVIVIIYANKAWRTWNEVQKILLNNLYHFDYVADVFTQLILWITCRIFLSICHLMVSYNPVFIFYATNFRHCTKFSILIFVALPNTFI